MKIDSSKTADIVVLKSGKREIFVIETKRVAPNGKITHDISPFSPKVIEQAKGYAKELKVEYYATFNGKYFVAFKINDPDEPIDEPIFRLEVLDFKEFASNLLKTIAGIMNNTINPISYEDLYSDQLKSYFNIIFPQYLAALNDKIKKEKSKKKSAFYIKLN